MHKHYAKADGKFADSYLCGKCFADKFLRYDTCQWCGNFITSIPYIDNQGRKYCSFDCVKRFMGYEECFDIQSEEFMKTIYHVVKVNSDDSFIPTTKNIIYTGFFVWRTTLKIIEPYYEILTHIDGKRVLQTIEYCARTCYQSYDKQTEDSCFQFVKMLMGRNHESCLEHYSFSVKFVVDRAIQNEIVRHRLSSFCCSSTRYCNYSKDKFGNEITVIRPFFFKEDTAEYELWKKAMEQAEYLYMNMIKIGCRPEEARSVLPLSLKTELVMTANIREWRLFFKLRTTPFAHPQMRQITIPLLQELKEKIPLVFDDISY